MGKPGVFKRIQEQDQGLRPFKVFKSWRYASTSSMVEDGVDRLIAIKPNPNVYSGRRVTLDTWQTELDSGSLLLNEANDKEASLVWYSLNHLYYKRAGKPGETFGYADPAKIERTIFDEAAVISIPQKKFGESIKPGSVNLRLVNKSTAISMSLQDDGKGNLVDTALSSSISNEVLYLGFNAMTYSNFWRENAGAWTTSNNIEEPIQVDTIINDLQVIGKNISIINASASYSVIGKSNPVAYGNAALFVGAYIKIPYEPYILDFKQSNDFAFSMWLGQDSSPTCPDLATVLSRRTNKMKNVLLPNRKMSFTSVVDKKAQYPYDLRIISGTLLEARQSDGSNTKTISGSLLPNAANHVVFNKTGSKIELYINGVLSQSSSCVPENFNNDCDTFIGSLGIDKFGTPQNSYIGALDEFFIFNKGLTSAEVNQLAYTGSVNLMTTNTNAVGNVFYEHGIIVVSDPRPKYTSGSFRLFNDAAYDPKTGLNYPSHLGNINLEYNSTVTLYEREYICRLREDEFNFSSNPTIREDNDSNSENVKAFVFDDVFSPYITTVGLYNDKGQLLAIGKLGTPIKKRDDVDLNIIVRFDI
jgi:hypothetical protein